MNDIEAIKEQVRMSTVLHDYHVQLLDSGVPEQLHCPFHYPDTNKSARFYPDNDSIYCFVCDHTWDVLDFVQTKEELSFVEAVKLVKARYDVTIYTPDYATRFWAVRKPLAADPEELAMAVERLFIKHADTLTSGNIYSILSAYNECLAAKDNLLESGDFSQENLTHWYEGAMAKLRTEFDNG
jgi:hypothetical protein